jgi:hypothetical protein
MDMRWGEAIRIRRGKNGGTRMENQLDRRHQTGAGVGAHRQLTGGAAAEAGD